MPYLLESTLAARSNDDRKRDIDGDVCRRPGKPEYSATLRELWDGGAGTVEWGTAFDRYDMTGVIIQQTTRKRYGYRIGSGTIPDSRDFWVVESTTVLSCDSAPTSPVVPAP
jgi:hypothetical protein